MQRRSRKPGAHDIAAEIVRRAARPDGNKRYVVRLSDPPTPSEWLQLIAARLERQPIVIMPHRCKTLDEWIARYSNLK